jgi:hypothetical protein
VERSAGRADAKAPDVRLDVCPEAEQRDRGQLPWDAHRSVTGGSDAWDGARRDAGPDAIPEVHWDAGAGKWADRVRDGRGRCEPAVQKQPELAGAEAPEAALCKPGAGRSAALPCDESVAATQVVRQAAAEQHLLSAAGLSEFEPAAASPMRARFPPEAAQSGAAARAELPSLKRRAALRSRPDAEMPAEQAAES